MNGALLSKWENKGSSSKGYGLHVSLKRLSKTSRATFKRTSV